MDQTKRQINPSQLKFAKGGTTGRPLTYGQNLQDELSVPEEETDNIELSTYNNDLNFNIPKNKIYFTGRNAILPNNSSLNTAYNTGITTPTTVRGFTPKYPEINGKYGKFMMFPNKNGINYDPNWYSPKVGKSFSDINNVPQIGTNSIGSASTGPINNGPDITPLSTEKKKTDWAGIGSTALEAAPMIYNLLQKKPDQMPTAPYMDTQMVIPERMSNEQDLREAERNYSAMVNDQSLPAAQRLLASRQLQSTKAQILQQTENQYKQDINRAQEVNAAKIHKNIDTAMKIKDINDANIGAYANQRAQAMGDISQLAQKKTLEKNMAKKNDMMMNTLKSTFPDYTFKDDGTIVNKEGKPLSAEELTKVKTLYNALMNYNGQGLYNNPNVDPAYMNSYQAWDYSYGSPENTNYNKATGKK